MPQWKKPDKSEVYSNRLMIAERARKAELRLPYAVADFRKSFGLTQEEFAKLLSMTRRQITEIETGKANPTLETLEKIGCLFGFVVGFVPRAP